MGVHKFSKGGLDEASILQIFLGKVGKDLKPHLTRKVGFLLGWFHV